MTARGSSASFDGRSGAIPGTCGADGCSRSSTIGRAAGGEDAFAGVGGLRAGGWRVSVTGAHAAVAVSKPATRTPTMIRSVLIKIIVGSPVRFSKRCAMILFRHVAVKTKGASRRAIFRNHSGARYRMWPLTTIPGRLDDGPAPPCWCPYRRSAKLPPAILTRGAICNLSGPLSRSCDEPAHVSVRAHA